MKSCFVLQHSLHALLLLRWTPGQRWCGGQWTDINPWLEGVSSSYWWYSVSSICACEKILSFCGLVSWCTAMQQLLFVPPGPTPKNSYLGLSFCLEFCKMGWSCTAVTARWFWVSSSSLRVSCRTFVLLRIKGWLKGSLRINGWLNVRLSVVTQSNTYAMPVGRWASVLLISRCVGMKVLVSFNILNLFIVVIHNGYSDTKAFQVDTVLWYQSFKFVRNSGKLNQQNCDYRPKFEAQILAFTKAMHQRVYGMSAMALHWFEFYYIIQLVSSDTRFGQLHGIRADTHVI